mgnify:CR=1 FL=1
MLVHRVGINPGNSVGPVPHTGQIAVHNGVAYFTATPDKPYRPEIGIRGQMQELLERIDHRLARVGSDKTMILSIDVTLANVEDVSVMNEVWNAWVDRAGPPARICTIGQFTKPDILVEVTVRAAVDDARFK